MNYERPGDMEPLVQMTTGDFIAQSKKSFQRWWNELPSGIWEPTELDYETGQVIWQTAYEDQSYVIELVLDSARFHTGSEPTLAEEYLGYVVDRFHGGSIAFPTKVFIDWLANHEDDYCSYLDESDQIQIRIKSRSDEPLPKPLEKDVYRIRPSSSEAARAQALQRFSKWWEGLDIPGSYEGRNLDPDETQVVWLAAVAQLWEELEAIYESAHAHSDVNSETARHELAYLVDSQHQGKLSFDVTEFMDWTERDPNIRRSRNRDTIAICVEHTM